MPILIVAATEFEIRPMFGHMALLRKEDDYLHHYMFRSMPVDLIIPGIGMMHTAFHLGKLFGKNKYSLAINAGIAGTYDPSLGIGTVVNVCEECIPEMSVEDGNGFISMFELGLIDPDLFPYRSGKLSNYREHSYPSINRLRQVKGNTVNRIQGIPGSIEKIRKFFPADVESMEGAAFLYACLMGSIPCIQIRSVSNLVEERDKSRWNVPLALKNLNSVLFDLVQELVSW